MLNNPFKRSQGFSLLVRLYQERLYFHIRKMLLSHDDTNDVLQNTFMKAWSNLNQFRGESKILTWIYRIATNETITFLNSSKKKYSFSFDEVDSFLLNTLEADAGLDGTLAEIQLQKAILTLPDKQRLVFNMKYFDELTYDQMQSILDTSVGALKASYHHAVKKLEKLLTDENFLKQAEKSYEYSTDDSELSMTKSDFANL